mmetsp:Transcript_46806/g.141777  ORF Transcript_46806/g.141777 Transcript_46806/m.141777 type:complete len:80 (+) Transcript_46806:145-384(+)
MISIRPTMMIGFFGVLCAILSCDAFVVKPHLSNQVQVSSTAMNLGNFGGGNQKKPAEDLSSIESRDMTKEEMLALNQKK